MQGVSFIKTETVIFIHQPSNMSQYTQLCILKRDKTSFRFYTWCLHLKHEWWQFFLYCLCLCHLEDNIEVSIKTGIPGEQTAVIKNDPSHHESKYLVQMVSRQQDREHPG